MDPHRFDRLSKAIAGRLTRRQMLGGLGAGGLAASALGESPTLAASAKTICVYDFDGTIDIGPSSKLGATNDVTGQLTIVIGAHGAIDSGKLTRSNGDAWDVAGQSTGRAINLRFDVPKSGAFIAVGTGQHFVAGCYATYAGPASGPLRHDAGSWTATLKSSGAPVSPTATTAPGITAVSISPTQVPTSVPTIEPTTAPTVEPTAAACDLECGAETLGRDPNSCACLCANGLSNCIFNVGSIPAKGGVIFRPGPITKPTGFCVDLSRDTSNCGACGNACPGGGSTCVNGTCECSLNCGEGNTAAAASCDCICNVAGTTPCGPRCVDLQTDSDNCGSCGHVCRLVENQCAKGACTGVSGISKSAP